MGGPEKDHRIEPVSQSHGWGKHPKSNRVLSFFFAIDDLNVFFEQFLSIKFLCFSHSYLIFGPILWTIRRFFLIHPLIFGHIHRDIFGVGQELRPRNRPRNRVSSSVDGTTKLGWSEPGLPSGKRLHNYGKSQLLMGKSTISMTIFNSYVSLPEGINHLLSSK
jgi:hypothetical protein